MQQLAVNLLLQVAPEGDAQLIPEPLPGGGELQRVELGESLLADGRPRFLAHLRPCWAVVDRWLVVATDPDWLRDIVAGWRGIEPVLVAPGLHEQVRQVQSGGGAAMTVVTAHPRLAAEMSDSWLTYLQREHSDLLSSTWWEGLRRRHSRGRVQLGFLAGRSASNELVVERTVEGAPAHLRLMPGDRILGVEGEPLDRTGPADSLRELIDRRKRSDRVALDIMRHGEALRIELNLPRDDVFPFQPAELLRRLSRLCENVSIARYAEWRPSRNLLHARLEVQFAEP